VSETKTETAVRAQRVVENVDRHLIPSVALAPAKVGFFLRAPASRCITG
jgi:hypothetical protein